MSEPVPEEFPLSDYALRLENAYSRLNGRMKYCGKNAFIHLRRAWRLKEVDQGMAAFRSITAEEEAATALMYALRRKKYPNADRLNPRRHHHKSSIHALMRVLSGTFAKLGYVPELYLFDKTDPPQIRMQIDIHKLAGLPEKEPFFAEPIAPLDFTLNDKNGVKLFSEEFSQFASESGFAETQEFINAEANLRNRILYAADNGIPKFEIKDEFIIDRKNRVLTILTIALMIEQSDTHQSFVVQCLNTLFKVLPRMENVAADDPVTPPPKPVRLEIERSASTKRIDVIRDGSRQTAQFEFTSDTTFKLRWLPPWQVKLVRYDFQSC